ncbi:hypothetical protein H0H87_011980 [Tephrocybe sp. NHM501043]|nr:hypothetical protein H0H87_011980 [Tephrocybe sp. NHM501043]
MSTNTPFDPADVVTTDRLEAYFDDDRRPMMNNYVRHAKIGDGHHGEVYLCYQLNASLPQDHPDRRLPVAMKSVKRDNPRAKQFRMLRQQRIPASAHTPLVDRLGTTEAKIRKEIAIMKKCRHPHVVRLYEIIDDRTRDKIYMVMEYLAGGEVKWTNENHEPILSYDQTRRIIRDAVLGLEYLHHQGIIHRDIKPANLLWTANRRQVKIADFGVSHFSYAQRLAAAGAEGVDDTEDILLDDSDLTRRAGTPSFLAPEIVYEHTNDPSPGSSSSADVPTAGESSLESSQSLNTSQRPPITKSIDIWALGITLYCLLFGKTPFTADAAASGTEWSLYNSICNSDWTADEFMCSDRVPTGGRHSRGDSTQGAIVMSLLDHLLKKDPKDRITLDEVKVRVVTERLRAPVNLNGLLSGSLSFQRHEWILRDLPDPDQWLKLTTPHSKIDVSADETSDAMSTIRFQWNWNTVARRVSSLFRRSREQKNDSSRGQVKSDPHVRIRRHQSARFPDDSFSSNSHKQDKGKQRAELQPPKSERYVRSKSTEPWPIAGSASATRSTSAIQSPRDTKPRRGSATLSERLNKTSIVSTSAVASEKPRARFAHLFNIKQWRPNKYLPQSNANASTQSMAVPSPSSHAHSSPAAVTRRSEEVLRHYRTEAQDPGNGLLTADRRASSWGQGDHSTEFAEAVSLTSSYEFMERNAAVASSGIYGDRLTPRTPRLTTNLSPSSTSPTSPILTPSDEAGLGVRGAMFGPACFEDDSSTIASGEADWRGGSDDIGHAGDRLLGGSHSFEDNDEDDEDESDQEEAVTFSPRRRPPVA